MAAREVPAAVMIQSRDYSRVAKNLESHLAPAFADVRVEVGDNIHYRGTNVVVTSSAFEGWLPEQRFHHVVRAIPPEFYEKFLRRGIVWFELTPGEDPKSYMRMPRSEDVAGDSDKIANMLRRAKFTERLVATLGPHPGDASPVDFKTARRVLHEAGWKAEDIRRACLFFILHGAYGDTQVLTEVVPMLMQPTASA